MFRRFRNYPQIGGKKSLPYDAEVEYIESTRTQYIDTGVVGSDDLVISGRFRYLKIDSAYSNILGCRSATGSTSDDQISFTASSNSYVGWGRSESQITNFEANTDYDFSFKRGLIVRNGVSSRFTAGQFIQSGLTIYLFCGNQAGSVANLSMSRIYKVSISNSNSLLIDLIPVRFTNELGVSEGAMYDKVSGKLFRNLGTGEFVVGPDKREWVNPYQTDDGALKFMLDTVFSPPTDNKWVDSIGGRIIPLNAGSYNLVDKYIKFVSTAYGPDGSMVDGLGLNANDGYTMQFVWKDGYSATSNNGFIVSPEEGIGSYWYRHACRGIRRQSSNPDFGGKDQWHTWSFIWKTGLNNPSYRDKTFYEASYDFPGGPSAQGARIEIGSGGYNMYAASVRVFNRQLTEDEVFRFCDLDKEIYGLT